MAAHSQIIAILERWPNRQAVLEDARLAKPDLDLWAVHRWFQRGSVPPQYDAALLQGAEKRGIGLHYMEFARARAGHTDQGGHASRSRQPDPAKKAGAV